MYRYSIAAVLPAFLLLVLLTNVIKRIMIIAAII